MVVLSLGGPVGGADRWDRRGVSVAYFTGMNVLW